jgi:integrase
MPAIVADRLRAHRGRQLLDRVAAGERWQDSGLVFTSRWGTPIHPENLGKVMRPYLEQAGCSPQRFHDLRHSCASLLLAQGVSPRVLMETLGHTRIGMTLDLYAHLYPEMRQEAADQMDRALSG